MHNPDGIEERVAFYDEKFTDTEDDLEETTDLGAELIEAYRKLSEARARLADIAMGATMMLQPACNVQGAMRGYVQEVKRVASAPL